MKILFTSVGRRVELIQAFKDAAENLNVDLQVYGADIDDTAPALAFCDRSVIVPKIKSSEYIPTLLDVCKKESIDCLVPTIDTDLLVLSMKKKEFERNQTKVFISSEDKIRICRNKNYTSDYFMSLGLNSPKTYNKVENYSEGFPAFIKPKDGSSSINAYRVDKIEDLIAFADQIDDYIIQKYIDGTEFTVDVFCDYNSNPIYITPRERIFVRAGEVLKTRICQDKTIIDEVEIIIKNFKPVGPITIQLIKENTTGKNFYIEINPRFGGGAPLSMKAGANSAEATIKILLGKQLVYEEFAARHNEVYSRYDQSVCVKSGKAYENN